MSMSLSALHPELNLLSEQIRDSLSKTQYRPPEGSNVSIKTLLQSLLPQTEPNFSEPQLHAQIRDFALCCAALASSQTSSSSQLSWIPNSLSVAAISAFDKLSDAFSGDLDERKTTGENKLLAELLPEVLPLLKLRIKESSIDKEDDGDEISAASARVPVDYAVVAACQFRWLVMQVGYHHLGKMCSLVIPCALTALDHWSPEVKGQGMICVMYLAKGVNAAELGWCADVILDACCQNLASDDKIWEHVVEMSVLVVTCTQQSNPRSAWYEKLLNEMLNHLERQPRNKGRRIVWLRHIEPLFNGVGLVLLAHFRRIFPLFFKWMHADDDETVLLVLDRISTVIKLTWVRNSPYVERLVDELVILYKEAALKIARDDIRTLVLRILILLQQCKGQQFESAWLKHKDDPNLTALSPSLNEIDSAMLKALAIETQ